MLDNVDDIVLIDKLTHRVGERERPDTAVIQSNILLRKQIERLLAGAVRTAQRQDGRFVEFRILNLGFRNHRSRGFPFHQQSIYDLLVLVRVLGIVAVFAVTGAACEVGAFRMHAR